MNKRVLFIGGSGLLAVNWANQITNHYDVHLGLHSRIVKFKGAVTIQLDTESTADLIQYFRLHQIDIVINCAGLTSVEECELNPILAHQLNTIIPSRLASICKDLEIKFVHISTDHLFSGNSAYTTEDQETDPQNVYGKTKLQGEQEVIKENEDALVIRTNFYGWGTTYRKSFSDFVIAGLRNSENIALFEDVYYTPILIDELVTSVHGLLDLDANGIFNVVGNERVSKLEFGRSLAKAFNLDLRLIQCVKFNNRKNLVNRPLDMSLSNLKLQRTLKRQIVSLNEQFLKLFNQENTGFNRKIIEL